MDFSRIRDCISKWNPNMTFEDECQWEYELLCELKPYRYENIGNDLKHIISALERDDLFFAQKMRYYHSEDIRISKAWYEKENFKSFMDYFTRKLSENALKEIQKNIYSFSMVTPCHGYIEASGQITDTHKIIRLKKPHSEIISDLKNIGISVSNYSFIDIKLLITHYHRIHSPISGEISWIKFFPRNENFFGDNTLWIIEFITEKGKVYMLVVGESEIQDFVHDIQPGKIEKFQELGYFNWGSQIVILYDNEVWGTSILQESKTYFVGSPIFK